MAITDVENKRSTMGADNINQWDGRYRARTHQSVWPWSDLVSLCERYVFSDLCKGPEVDILEVGCGCGANIPYLLATGGRYHGIDGSETAIDELRGGGFSLPADQLACADFTQSLHFDKSFDLIVDRASVTNNTDASINRCIDLIRSKLRSGGYFVGVAWFSKAHSEYQRGHQVVGDPHSRTAYIEGPFAHVGLVHFTDEENLRSMLSEFEIIWMEHKISQEIIPDSSHIDAFFNFVARKNA